MRVTSEEGISLIKKFEGCELNAYQCSANVWTIGYGHTRGVSEGDSCTQKDADDMLVDDLQEFEGYVNELVDADLTQSQFDALVAWTYNLGPTNLKDSTLLKRLNEGDMADVPHQIRRWNKAGGKRGRGVVVPRKSLGKCLASRSKTLRFYRSRIKTKPWRCCPATIRWRSRISVRTTLSSLLSTCGLSAYWAVITRLLAISSTKSLRASSSG